MASVVSVERGSQREYAKHRGVSHVAVGKAVKAGRIALDPDGKINFAKADLAWDQNTNPAKQAKPKQERTHHDPLPAPKTAGTKPKSPVTTHEGPVDQPTEPPMSMMQAQTLKAIYSAKREELKFEEEAGKKIDAEDVKAKAFARARRARDMILSAPARIAPLLVGMDILGITLTLEEEFRRVVEEISRDAASV